MPGRKKQFELKMGVWLTAEQLTAIDRLANRLDISRSDLMRHVLNLGLPIIQRWIEQSDGDVAVSPLQKWIKEAEGGVDG